jgi:hypothetical protein
MRKKIVSDYVIETDAYSLVVDYVYTSDDGSWTQPPEEDLEITKVTLYMDEKIAMDITQFYWDWVEGIDDLILEEVRNA